MTINKLERSAIGDYLGGSSLYPEGVSKESVPLKRLVFDEPFDDSYQIFVGRLGFPVSLGIVR